MQIFFDSKILTFLTATKIKNRYVVRLPRARAFFSLLQIRI